MEITFALALHEGHPVVSSLALARGIDRSHKFVIKLIRQYQDELQHFGSLPFERAVMREDGRGGEPTEYALLNEAQATLLFSLMRNIPVVLAFKVRLVKAFYEMREALAKRESAAPDGAALLAQIAGMMQQQGELLQRCLAAWQPAPVAIARDATIAQWNPAPMRRDALREQILRALFDRFGEERFYTTQAITCLLQAGIQKSAHYLESTFSMMGGATLNGYTLRRLDSERDRWGYPWRLMRGEQCGKQLMMRW